MYDVSQGEILFICRQGGKNYLRKRVSNGANNATSNEVFSHPQKQYVCLASVIQFWTVSCIMLSELNFQGMIQFWAVSCIMYS